MPVLAAFFCQILMSISLDAYVMFCFWLPQLRRRSLPCLKSNFSSKSDENEYDTECASFATYLKDTAIITPDC